MPRERQGEQRGALADARRGDAGHRTGHQAVVLGGGPAQRGAAQAGREHERAVGTGQGRAHRLDRAPVGGPGGRKVALAECDLVLEGEVDHAVGLVGRLGQDVGVVEVAALDRGAGSVEFLGGRIRAGQAHDVVAGLEEFGDDGGADPARRSGDEDLHGVPPATAMSETDINDRRHCRPDDSDCQHLGVGVGWLSPRDGAVLGDDQLPDERVPIDAA